MTNVERFMHRFIEVWKAPEAEDFATLFTADATLFHPTMGAPISAPEIPGYVARIKALAPDITLRVENWAAKDDVVLVEWTITATFQREQMAWNGADRFTLQGDRAKDGVAYFDTMGLWARIDPALVRPPIDEVLAPPAGSVR